MVWYRARLNADPIPGIVTKVHDENTVDIVLFPGIDTWDICPNKHGQFFAERVIGSGDITHANEPAHIGAFWEWPR